MNNQSPMSQTHLMMVIACIGALIFFANMASADIYRYIDHHGVVRFTDNPADIPSNQRAKMKKIITRSTSPEVSDSTDESDPDVPPIQPVDANPIDIRQLEFERLSQEKLMLDEEFNELIKAKEALEQSTDKIDAQAYNEKVTQLNDRISAYEEKRAAFKAAADAFNAQISQ